MLSAPFFFGIGSPLDAPASDGLRREPAEPAEAVHPAPPSVLEVLEASGAAARVRAPTASAPDPRPALAEAVSASSSDRLRSIVVTNHALVWRTARRFGVPTSRIDDAVSRVFDVVTRRLGDLLPGREQAFIVQTCMRVASELRRSEARRTRFEEPTDRADETASPTLSPEELLDREQARALLDEALDTLDDDTRIVFVLHELEGWTASAIAESLSIPPGTAGSRLRRGRQQFERAAARLRQRLHDADIKAAGGGSQ